MFKQIKEIVNITHQKQTGLIDSFSHESHTLKANKKRKEGSVRKLKKLPVDPERSTERYLRHKRFWVQPMNAHTGRPRRNQTMVAIKVSKARGTDLFDPAFEMVTEGWKIVLQNPLDCDEKGWGQNYELRGYCSKHPTHYCHRVNVRVRIACFFGLYEVNLHNRDTQTDCVMAEDMLIKEVHILRTPGGGVRFCYEYHDGSR